MKSRIFLKISILVIIILCSKNVYAESVLLDDTNYKTKTYKNIHLAISDIKDTNLNGSEIVNYMGDFLQNGTYYAASERDQTYYGLLGDGYAVCAGHNDTARYLSNTAGINCVNLVSTSYRHMITTCYFNHDWYYFDATGSPTDIDAELDNKRYDVRAKLYIQYSGIHPVFGPIDPYNRWNSTFFGEDISNVSFKKMSMINPMPNGQDITTTDHTFFDSTYRYYIKNKNSKKYVYRQNRNTNTDTQLAELRTDVPIGNNSYNFSDGLVKDLDYLYYINVSDNNVYKMKTDGTSKTKVSNDDAINLWRTNEGIYIFNKTDNVKKIANLNSYPATGTKTINDSTSSYKLIYAYNSKGATIMGVDGINGESPRGVIEIPETLSGVPVIGIAPYAFFRFSKEIATENLILPSNLLYIGESAFFSTNIKKVTLNSKLKSIANDAFELAKIEGKLTIPASVTHIGNDAFYGNSITDVEFLGNIDFFNDGIFGNNKLTKVDIPDSLEVYSSYLGGAYYKNEIENLVFGSNLKYLDFSSNYGTTEDSLKNIVIESNNLVFINKGKIDTSKVKFYIHAGTTTQTTLDNANIPWINLDTVNYVVESEDTNITVDKSRKTRQLTYSVNPNFLKYTEKSWVSSNTSVATVDSKGLLTLKSAGETTITLTLSTGQKGIFHITVTDNPITSLSLGIPNTNPLPLGKYRMNITIEPYDADPTGITYTSSNPEVLRINEYDGKYVDFETLKGGETTLTITAPNGVKEEKKYRVYYKPHSFTITNKNESIYIGDNFELEKNIISDGEYEDIYYFESEDSNIVEVKDAKKGKFYAKSVGETYIRLCENSNSCARALVQIQEIPVSSVLLNKTSLTLVEGKSETLVATVLPDNTTNKKLTWSSSKPSVATVVDGKVEAIKEGTAIITAITNNATSARCTVTVKKEEIAVTNITLNKDNLQLETGDIETLTATITPDNATNKNVTWTSSNAGVASVSNGKVTAKSVGTAVITATSSNGLKATCTVKVSKKVIEVESIALDIENLELVVGSEYTFIVTILPVNATNKVYTLTSSNPQVITANGKTIKALKPGDATVTVETENGKSATCQVTAKAKEVAVTGISLNKTSLLLTKGNSETLIATITPSDATNKSVTWTSSDNSVATVDSNGKVTGVKAGKATITAKTSNNMSTNAEVIVEDKTLKVSYRTHVQKEGWQNYVSNGEMSGTSGKALRLEAIQIKLENQDHTGDILYRTHIQTYGWEKEFKKNDEMSGTSGEAKRLEAIEIKLDGEMSSFYDIYYRVHAEKFGWLGWARNGESAGTAGYAYRLEAIEIKLVAKGSDFPGYGTIDAFKDKNAPTGITLNKTNLSLELNEETNLTATILPSDATNKKVTWTSSNAANVVVDNNGHIKAVHEGTAVITAETINGKKAECTVSVIPSITGVEYRTHVQTYGWQDFVKNGEMSGTSGEAKRLEGIEIKLRNQGSYGGDIEYRTHIQTYGWEKEFKKNGEMSGTSGEAKRLEAIEIKLTGEMASHYDIYYRVHAQKFGWLNWAKNGESAGTAGYAYRLEGIEIMLVEKGSAPPERTNQNQKQAFIEK